jgi:hypothetical protein
VIENTHLWRKANVADHPPLAPLFVPELLHLLDPAATSRPAFAVCLVVVLEAAGSLGVVHQDVVLLIEGSLHDLCGLFDEVDEVWRVEHSLLLLLCQISHRKSVFLLGLLANLGRLRAKRGPELFLDFFPNIRSDSLELILSVFVRGRIRIGALIFRRHPVAVCLRSFLVGHGFGLFRPGFRMYGVGLVDRA